MPTVAQAQGDVKAPPSAVAVLMLSEATATSAIGSFGRSSPV